MAEMTYRQKKKALLALCGIAAALAIAAAALPAIAGAGDDNSQQEQQVKQETGEAGAEIDAAGQDSEQENEGQGAETVISDAKRAALEKAISSCLRENGFDPDETEARILLETTDEQGNPVCYFRVDPDWCFSAVYSSEKWTCSPLRERVEGVNDDLSDDRIYSSSTRRVTESESASKAPSKTCPLTDAGTLARYIGADAAQVFADDFAAFLAEAAPGHDAAACQAALGYANTLDDGTAVLAVYDPSDGSYYTAKAKKGAAHAEFSKQ